MEIKYVITINDHGREYYLSKYLNEHNQLWEQNTCRTYHPRFYMFDTEIEAVDFFNSLDNHKGFSDISNEIDCLIVEIKKVYYYEKNN
jgi:hypothetical protein